MPQTQASQDGFTKIEVTNLPEIVTQAVAKSNEGSTIKEAFITEAEGGKIYKVVIVAADAKEVTVFLNEKGEEVKA